VLDSAHHNRGVNKDRLYGLTPPPLKFKFVTTFGRMYCGVGSELGENITSRSINKEPAAAGWQTARTPNDSCVIGSHIKCGVSFKLERYRESVGALVVGLWCLPLLRTILSAISRSFVERRHSATCCGVCLAPSVIAGKTGAA